MHVGQGRRKFGGREIIKKITRPKHNSFPLSRATVKSSTGWLDTVEPIHPVHLLSVVTWSQLSVHLRLLRGRF